MVLRPATFAVALVACASSPAFAERATTRDALDRLEEVLEMRIEDGELSRTDVVPAIVVSTAERYEESVGAYPARALASLTAVFGPKSLRVCEACMVPRTFAAEGRLEQSSGPIGLDEIRRLDTAFRGNGQPARTAIWLDEHAAGVALKIVDLATGQVVWAENVDPLLKETEDTEYAFKLAREYERRARGESITQAFVDVAVYPGQHVSLDWTDQWGDNNTNFTGVTLSLFDPVIGLGANYYRAFDFGEVFGIRIAPQIGVKLIMSVPNALITAISDDAPDEDFIDPLLTGVAVLRLPFGETNYGLLLTASTNGRVGIGLTLLNVSLLPVIL